MNSRVTPDLARGYIVVCWMDTQAQDVVRVSRVELLCVGRSVVDHSKCGNVVDNPPVLSIVEVVPAVVPSIAVGRYRNSLTITS